MKRIALTAAAVALAGGAFVAAEAPVAEAQQKFVTIGTGGVTACTTPRARAICRLVNKDRKRHGIRCSVESTGGSVYNLNTIRAGELDMGVAQSDWQYHAYHGTSKFKDAGPFKELRAVFSSIPSRSRWSPEPTPGSWISWTSRGRRVNIGNPGSGQRGTMEVVMAALGWDKGAFMLASELKSAEQSKALCDNKIDAMVFTVGHPSGSIKKPRRRATAFSCRSRAPPSTSS